MIHCKRVHAIIIFLAFTFIYILIQLSFMYNIKILNLDNLQQEKSVADDLDQLKRVNPKFRNKISNQFSVINDQLNKGINSVKTTLSHRRVKQFSKIKNIEMQIPLDSYNQPYLFNILPFYHKYNSFNYSIKYVEVSIETNKDFGNNFVAVGNKQITSTKPFVNIEEENRVIDNIKVKADNLDDSSNVDILRGIDIYKADLYRPDESGLFKCINSNQRIPYSNVNDEYCDCIDGTDEPGTSACPFSIFYCSIQNEFLDNNFIHSHKVDDKICDCCDGSDEISIKCPNTCQDKINSIKSKNDEKMRALVAKEKYIQGGFFNNDKQYGPKSVFYKLSKKCFNINWSEFMFEVCPYKKVLQHKNGMSTNIGIESSLIQSREHNINKWILKMSGGDTQFCEHPRESYIHFECHYEDILKSVQEPEKCVYKFELLTPAAC